MSFGNPGIGQGSSGGGIFPTPQGPGPGQVAAPQSVARAFRTAAFNTTNGIGPVPMDTISYDPGNNIDLINGNYIVPITGVYLVIGILKVTATAAGQIISAGPQRNGSTVAAPQVLASQAGNYEVGGPDIILANKGDTLGVGYSTSAALALAIGQPTCFFSVARIG